MFSFFIQLLGLTLTQTSNALSIRDSIAVVGGTFKTLGNTGFSGVEAEALRITDLTIPYLFAVAVLAIAITGAEMAISQSDDTVTKARRAFIGSIVGLVLLVSSLTIKNILFSGAGSAVPDANVGIQLSQQMAGVVNYFTMILGVLAVLMIIISGIRAIIEFGSGEGLGHLRRTIFGVIFGMSIVALRGIILAVFYYDGYNMGSQNVNGGGTLGGGPGGLNLFITTIVDLFQQVLTFLGAIAVAIIMYAGLMMIVNFGNEEQFTKARNLIFRVGIGFIIILASKAIIGAVFTGLTT